jgi:hypothetical protein
MTEKDRMTRQLRNREAYERLRTYYRLNFEDGASDAQFLRWVATMAQQARRCDHCGQVFGLHVCRVCGGVTCENCAAESHGHMKDGDP